ncbi:MAG TPA: DUF364 domain-containing protein [Thermoflexia bacterium]|jgi:uncharacterized protein (DUF4213/DUF364 family)|nr:DUF364 domain-containing protein [Thermoflexia bacterium]
MSVVEAWVADLRRVLDGASPVVEQVRIGVFYTAARLESGHVGVAFTPRGLTDTVCCPRSAAAAPPSGRLAGQEAWTLAEYAFAPQSLRRAVGVAVLNALSALAMDRFGVPGGRLLPGVDALEAAGVQPDDRVAMVGAFVPFIKALKGKVAGLWVVDRHREALKPDELSFWRPPAEAQKVLSQADVVIITGSALVEGGIDDLLEAASGARRVVLAGPTASPWPPPFFERGVDVLGGIRVLDGPRMLQVVAEGGSGYFFGTVAEKVCVVRQEAGS